VGSVGEGDAGELAVADTLGSADGDGEGVGIAVPVGSTGAVSVDEDVEAGVGVGVSNGVGVGIGVGDVVGVTDGEDVGVGPEMVVDAGVGPEVRVGVGEPEGSVRLGEAVPSVVVEGDAEGPGTGVETSDCGTGFGCTNQSAQLLSVSCVFPFDPPGRRSMLDFAGGAGAAIPSTYEFTAVPHPTASMTAPPRRRSATAPPSAARPPM
jgi:hypothetical protein